MLTSRRSFLLAGAATLGSLAMPSVCAVAASPIEVAISDGAPTYGDLKAALTSQFAASHAGEAVRFVPDGDNWDPLLQNTLREAIVNAVPDGTWQSLTYAPLLARRGIAQPLNALGGEPAQLEALGLARPLIDAPLVDGKVFALPFGTTIPVVYCNMDLLHKAGYQKDTAPASWEEIVDIGQRVAALGGNINGGYIEYDSTNAWIFQNLLASYGGRMMNDAATEIAFDGPEGLKSLQTLWDFGAINNVDMPRDQARQSFNAGVSGIHIRSASGISSVAQAVKGHFELQIGQFPVPGPNGRLIGAGHGFIMFAKDPAKQRAVWDFIKFAAQSDGQALLAKHTGYLPINMLTLNDPKFLEQYFKDNPYYRPIVQNLAITGDQFSFPSDNTVKIVQMMADEMQRVVTHRAKPAPTLASMVAQTKQMLAQG